MRFLEQSTRGASRTDPHSLRTHAADTVHLLPRRGLNMAADLAGTPVTGLRVQACGDCHLLNFGAYATPERRLVSTSTTWMRRFRRLGNGTSSASRRASSWRAGTTASPARREGCRTGVCALVPERMAEYSDMAVWRCGIRASRSKKASRRSRTRRPAGGRQKRLADARERSVLEHDFPKLATVPVSAHDQGQAAPDLPSAART